VSKSSAHLTTLRDQTDDELNALLVTTRDELFRLHLGAHTNQVTSSALLTTKRRQIAQIMTVLSSRKHGLEQQANATKTEAPAAEEAPAKKTKTKKAKS